MTRPDIDALKAAAEKATPGPWTAFDRSETNAVLKGERDQVIHWTGFDASKFPDDRSANCTFIALANPAAILRLIAHVERIKSLASEIVEAIDTGEPPAMYADTLRQLRAALATTRTGEPGNE